MGKNCHLSLCFFFFLISPLCPLFSLRCHQCWTSAILGPLCPEAVSAYFRFFGFRIFVLLEIQSLLWSLSLHCVHVVLICFLYPTCVNGVLELLSRLSTIPTRHIPAICHCPSCGHTRCPSESAVTHCQKAFYLALRCITTSDDISFL